MGRVGRAVSFPWLCSLRPAHEPGWRKAEEPKEHALSGERSEHGVMLGLQDAHAWVN